MSAKNVKSSVHAQSSSNSKVNKITATVTSQPITTEIEILAGTATSIPIIRSKDLAKQLPVYAEALKRSVDDCLAAENLDSIQLELEKLLSNVALRYRALKTEYDNLERDEKKNKKINSEKTPKSPDINSTTSTGKRKREECLSTPTASRRKSQYVSSGTTHKHSKYVKVGSSSAVSQQNEDSLEYVPTGSVQSGRTTPACEPATVKPTLPKNDMPNKFWLSIEPYCMPITNEDLRLIDELREQYAGALLPDIPELGPHYSDVWAEEQLKELQQSSSSNQRNKTSNNNEAAAMLKKAENLMDETITGPLTQRLVTALIEEKLLPPTNENQSNNIKNETGTPLRSLSMLRNGIGIEQRIKQELIEQGILEESDLSPNGEEDEIYNEIIRLRVELSAIAEHNCSELKRLRETAVEEIKRLEIKRKLDVIDQEIMETYKRTMQSKAKRQPLSVEEQQEIFRLTAEQRSLSDQLEQTEVKPFHYE